MRITGYVDTRTCAVCGRSLLMGERAVRYAPEGDDFVDVCPLCQEIATEQGWLKEGSPTSPVVAADRPRRRLSLTSIFERARPVQDEPVASDPILRRLSPPELAMVESADLFNASAFRRTIAGIAKSLGAPRASILPLSGVNSEVVVTIAWDLSWYQYRVAVDSDSAQPVRLEERGHELADLDPSYRTWNARVEDDGRLVPTIERV
jgi:hypothetical protein